MSDEWVARAEHALKALEALKAKKKRDRLEMIKNLFLILSILNRSVSGWRNWIQNLSFMARFTEEELNEFKDVLTERTIDFLRYDIEVMKKFKSMMPEETPEENSEDTRGMYT